MADIVNRPANEWLLDAFAAVDPVRRELCAAASASGGDPPCWRCLPASYARAECSAGCFARAVAALKAERDALREGLAGVLAGDGLRRGNGHCHAVPGIWDDDGSNGALAGMPCEWCALWDRARALIGPAQ